MSKNDEIRILLVEDDEDDFIFFNDYLNEIKLRNYHVSWESSYERGLKLIEQKAHDIYFFDCILGKNSGLDLIRECVNLGIDAPVILLTGYGNHETDIAAMELGAVDYLIKDEIDSEKLERSIRYSIEQAKSLKKIKASEEKFRSIFENSQDVIYIADSCGKIYDINKAAELVFGYSCDELKSMNEVELFEVKQDWLKFNEAISKNEINANLEVIFVDKFKNKKYCTVTTTVQRRDEKGIVYFQAIVHDLTRRIKIEQDLRIAEKQAVSGRMARLLAHEIRNPLTNINLSVEQLEEFIVEEDFKSYFEIIKRNSKRINDLVTELIDHSKPAKLKPAMVPIQLILENTITLVKDRAALKNIKIESNFNGGNELIECDVDKLTVALLNIILNAIEAVKEHHGIIKFSSNCKGKRCMIIIQDNGNGIIPDNLNKIFDPYYTAKSNGVGLGLSTTHNIINSHKGTIEVESTPEKGTKFLITLNLH